jgi:Pyruvate/2-oxoacid:ferredoxin oxidoreductase gamma subunit
MVALGLLSTLFDNVDFSHIHDIIKDMLPKSKSELAELNFRAFSAGRELRGENN